MIQKKLPNATLSLILGIISFIACCLTSGFGGLILSGIALVLTNKDIKRYNAAPEEYINYKEVKSARTIAIIGLVLAIVIVLITIVALITFGGVEGYKEYMEELMREYES